MICFASAEPFKRCYYNGTAINAAHFCQFHRQDQTAKHMSNDATNKIVKHHKYFRYFHKANAVILSSSPLLTEPYFTFQTSSSTNVAINITYSSAGLHCKQFRPGYCPSIHPSQMHTHRSKISLISEWAGEISNRYLGIEWYVHVCPNPLYAIPRIKNHVQSINQTWGRYRQSSDHGVMPLSALTTTRPLITNYSTNLKTFIEMTCWSLN